MDVTIKLCSRIITFGRDYRFRDVIFNLLLSCSINDSSLDLGADLLPEVLFCNFELDEIPSVRLIQLNKFMKI